LTPRRTVCFLLAGYNKSILVLTQMKRERRRRTYVSFLFSYISLWYIMMYIPRDLHSSTRSQRFFNTICEALALDNLNHHLIENFRWNEEIGDSHEFGMPSLSCSAPLHHPGCLQTHHTSSLYKYPNKLISTGI